MEELLLEETLCRMLEAHRLMRHDYMNHFQIIAGYLQLGQAEKAREYINKISRGQERFKDLGRIETPVLRSLLLYYLVPAEDGCFNLDVTGKICLEKKDDRNLARLLKDIIDQFYERILSHSLRCRINIKEEEAIEVSLWGSYPSLDESIQARHPLYSLAVTEKAENAHYQILITKRRK